MIILKLHNAHIIICIIYLYTVIMIIIIIIVIIIIILITNNIDNTKTTLDQTVQFEFAV